MLQQTLRMSTQLAFPPTFVLPVAELILPMCHKMVWLALFTGQCLGQPIITYRGTIRIRVGKQIVRESAQQELTSDCLTSDCHL